MQKSPVPYSALPGTKTKPSGQLLGVLAAAVAWVVFFVGTGCVPVLAAPLPARILHPADAVEIKKTTKTVGNIFFMWQQLWLARDDYRPKPLYKRMIPTIRDMRPLNITMPLSLNFL